VSYPIGETIASLEEHVPDPLTRQMLSDIYRKGAYLTKWFNKNGHSATNGTNGTSHEKHTEGQTGATPVAQ
jgi:hypothetical protein